MIRKVFNIGQDQDKERWDIAGKVVDSKPPDTKFHVKDHKIIPEGQTCPATRKLCNATDGPISRLENVSTIWFDRLAAIT